MMRSSSKAHGIQLRCGTGSVVENGGENDAEAFAAKRKRAGGHLVEHRAKREEVGARIESFGADLLGRHVGDGAKSRAGTGEVVWLKQDAGQSIAGFEAHLGTIRGRDFGQAEIENLGVAAFGDEDVGGFDVAMDDAFCVGGVECVGDFRGKRKKKIGLEGLAGDSLFESYAVQKFHGEIGAATLEPDFINSADVGMVEGGGGCASRWKRVKASGSRATSSGRNLSATKRRRSVSSAL